MAEKIFADGIRFEKPREGSPEFVKGRLSFKVAEAVAFLQKHETNAGWVNLDLKKSKEGKLYLELNAWQPTEKKQGRVPMPEGVEYPEEELGEDNPF
jgi:hypothetical protein